MVVLEELKEKVKGAVDDQRQRLYEISKFIYENPELGSEEFKAAELLTGELEKNGFDVERGIFGMPTAFCATFKGKGDGPKVTVLAEYDALPGVGHGCGHNLIAASAIGAGIAAGKVMESLNGEVLVVGTPAEEGNGPSGGAKVIMAEKGFWDDIDGAIMLHPSSAWGVGSRALGISLVLWPLWLPTCCGRRRRGTRTWSSTASSRRGGLPPTSSPTGLSATSGSGAATMSIWKRWWTRWPVAPKGPP